MKRTPLLLGAVAALALVAAGCGSDDTAPASAGGWYMTSASRNCSANVTSSLRGSCAGGVMPVGRAHGLGWYFRTFGDDQPRAHEQSRVAASNAPCSSESTQCSAPA